MTCFTYLSTSCNFNKKTFLEQLKPDEYEECSIRPVMVRIFDIRWIFGANIDFLRLAPVLIGKKNDLYKSQFINSLLDQFWLEDKWKIGKT